MPLRLSEHREQDRPRERLWSVGPAALTGQELLAILLGTGCAGRDALAVAGDVLGLVEGSLRRLAARPLAEVARVPGVGRSKAARVAAALELGRRVGAEAEPRPERIRGPADVHRLCATRFRDLAVTRQLVDAGRLLDLPVYDHVIVGGDRYVSFAEAGLL